MPNQKRRRSVRRCFAAAIPSSRAVPSSLATRHASTSDSVPMRGALAVAQGAAAHGIGRVVVPASRAREAALVEGVEVIAVEALHEAVDVLAGRREVPPLPDRVSE